MTRKQAKTFHLLAIASSLEAQNQAVGLLLQVVHTVLSLNDKFAGREELQKVADETRAAIWPDDDA